MAERTQAHQIAPDQKYTFVCPYCFNMAGAGDGTPIPHTRVEFRSMTRFANMREIEQKTGVKEIDLGLIGNPAERKKRTEEFEKYKRFLMHKDDAYQQFWSAYDGHTTEQADDLLHIDTPWEMPIVRLGDGVDRLVADADGFVEQGVDTFGHETYSRVCPFCHNPLPKGFGKHPVKSISIIGITGAGKTVYISQLLKGMEDYAAKAGLSAYYLSDHERDFIEKNRVERDLPLPKATSYTWLSQPMFYDIVRMEGNQQKTDTIVLYDIAGENCTDATGMQHFGQFVKRSDGLILLITPQQLGFVQTEQEQDEEKLKKTNPGLVLTTLHNALLQREGERNNTPLAVCVSKSDMCPDVLPAICQDPVRPAETDMTGMRKKEFDGKTFNAMAITGSNSLKKLMVDHAGTVLQNLNNGYNIYNFFAVSAIGCRCDKETGKPVAVPNPRRIEEPILWLFKHFGYIRTNERVLRPRPIPHAPSYAYQKGFLKKPCLVAQPTDYSTTEEEPVRPFRRVLVKKEWQQWSDDKFAGLTIVAPATGKGEQ